MRNSKAFLSFESVINRYMLNIDVIILLLAQRLKQKKPEGNGNESN